MLGYHTIDHSKHPRMEYRQRASEEKGGVMQGGSLKLFCSEVAFLTGCYRPGDIVVYVGGRTVQQIPLLVKMFPGIHFDIFDSRPKETDQWMGVGERDCTFICRRFKDSDAVGYNSICKRVLFVSDTRSVSRDSTCRSSFSVTDDNIMDDLRQQESWVETMCPRESLLKFRLPFDSSECVSYLDGDLYIQPFTQRSSTEVRLHVSSPSNSAAFKRRDYDCKAHEEVMFYHNCTTRRGHIEEEQHALSYDQKLGHNIIARWADKVKADPSLVPSNTDPDQHVLQVAKDIDKVYGKMLSMRYSDRFGKMVTPVVDD